MSSKIFISYRRADSADFTVALYNELVKYFGTAAVFKDINKIPPGMDFSEVLEQALDDSVVVLVLIGPTWISESGHRLFQEHDWVRQEIVRSLERDLRVVPVLLNGADLPQRKQLPPDLHPLLNRQLARVDNRRFAYDIEQLARGISDLVPLRRKRTSPTTRWDNVFKAIILLLMLIGIGLVGFAWTVSEGDFKEKVFMSVLGSSAVLGGWAAFTRQRWIELRANQLRE
ncbi:MAG: toll/interleukin-1 receptor domain-containing protein [Bacteroidota bacterium]